MELSRLVAQIIPFVWVVWIATTSVLAVRVLRDDVWPCAPRRRGLWFVLALSAAAALASLVLPMRIDASGLMELSGGTEPWKGASGEALLRALRLVLPLSPTDIIHVTRAGLVPTCALAVLSLRLQRTAPPGWTKAGLDVQQVMSASVLLLTPSFLFGGLGVFNFWFFCSVVLAMLLAWEDLSRAPSWASRLCLLSSVVLIGFARPETIAGGIVVAALVVLFAWKNKDWKLLVPALVVALALGAVAPTVVAYLGDRMRNQPLLTGSDATGDAPTWMLPWIAFRRILLHAPLNLAVLFVAFHALGLLAFLRAVSMIRQRRASWPEIAAMALILAEFLAIGVHREGFARYIKYGQLLVAPSWYLAARACYTLPPVRKIQAWLVGSVAGGIAVSLASTLVSWLGYTRCSLPEGRTFSARMTDQTLLWVTAPRWANTLCPSQHERERVVVVGLDERAEQDGSVELDMFSPPSCEPERWPIAHLLKRAGCVAVAAYPEVNVAVEDALFDPTRGALCRDVPFQDSAWETQPATHAIVSYYRAERLSEIRSALGRHPSCPWEIEEITESAVLLRRSAP